MIGVGRVAKPEQHCHEEDESKRGPVGKPCDPAVQHSHHPWQRPGRHREPEGEDQERTRRRQGAHDTASPTAVMAPAKPTLNATIRTSP
jgi:hypothetical protein